MSKLLTVTFKVEVPDSCADLEEGFIETTMDGMASIMKRANILYNYGIGSFAIEDTDMYTKGRPSFCVQLPDPFYGHCYKWGTNPVRSECLNEARDPKRQTCRHVKDFDMQAVADHENDPVNRNIEMLDEEQEEDV